MHASAIIAWGVAANLTSSGAASCNYWITVLLVSLSFFFASSKSTLIVRYISSSSIWGTLSSTSSGGLIEEFVAFRSEKIFKASFIGVLLSVMMFNLWVDETSFIPGYDSLFVYGYKAEDWFSDPSLFSIALGIVCSLFSSLVLISSFWAIN